MLLDAQIRTEDLFARNEERFGETEQSIERLIGALARTDEKLQALIEDIRGKNLGGLLA